MLFLLNKCKIYIMNYFDLIVFIYLLYFAVMGYYRGFVKQTFDLLALFLSIFLAYKFYQPVASLFTARFAMPPTYAGVFSFFAVWFALEAIYYVLFAIFYNRIPVDVRESKVNSGLGVIPSLIRGLIFAWVILSLFLVLPLSQSTKELFEGSFAGKLAGKTSKSLEKQVGGIFNKVVSDAANFLTVKPEGDEKVELGFTEQDVVVDAQAENKMLNLVNKERTDRELQPLTMDTKLQAIARAHSKDMFAKGYFSHRNLEGLSPFDRMDNAGIKYLWAGENLALAPTLESAHIGLMNSEGHKRNILDPEFKKIGIGVIYSKDHGLMFSQEFTD